MSSHEPKSGPPRLGISLSQLLASALAAASAAFGASYLGVAGTIIGAAVASVIATVAGAMYTSSLQRTRHVVRSTVTQWSRTAAVAPVVDPNAPTPGDSDDTRELVIAPEPPRAARPLPWARLAVAAAAVLAVTLGALTGLEALLGKPISSAVGGSHATGTTLGSVGGSGRSHPGKKAPTPSAPTPTPSSTPSTTPSGDPTTTPTAEPTTDPSGSATAPPTSTPTPSPSAEPTQTPTAGG